MYEINTRIKYLRKTLNLNQTEFGNKIGLAHSSLSDIENNNCLVTKRNIISICKVFNVNEEWLVNGTGNMFIEIDKKYDEFFSIYNHLSNPLQEFLLKVGQDLLETQEKL